MSQDGIINAFLRRFLDDRSRGQVLSVQEYQALWPDFEKEIAAEFARQNQSITENRFAELEFTPEGIRLVQQIGPYKILQEIGRGGQGVVYLAEDIRTYRKVALKLLTGMGVFSEQALKRFRREAALAGRIEHPGLCRVYDSGTQGNVPFIAMQFVEGETLSARIATARTPDGTAPATVEDVSDVPDDEEVTRIVRIAEQAARALHAAHEAGIIHRDLKPGNIMITPEGDPVILDFGLAKAVGTDEDESLTSTGDFFGTPRYMSPEQLGASRIPLDRRTDIYSLGVTLFECLTLRSAYEVSTRGDLLQAIMAKKPLDPRKLNPAVSRDLRAVLEKAIEKDRDFRYDSALELAEDLHRVREQQPVSARHIGPVGRVLRKMRLKPAVLAETLVAAFLVTVLVLLSVLAQPRVRVEVSIDGEEYRGPAIVCVDDVVLDMHAPATFVLKDRSRHRFTVLVDPEKGDPKRSRVLSFAGDLGPWPSDWNLFGWNVLPARIMTDDTRFSALHTVEYLDLQMVRIQPGRFRMGNDRNEKDHASPEHLAYLSRPFYIGKFEVTQGEYRIFVKENNYTATRTEWKDKNYCPQGDRIPVTFIAWHDAMAFCTWLTDRERKAGKLPAGYEYRLPTEAEWEYCCRAERVFGNEVGEEIPLEDRARFDENCTVGGEEILPRVGTRLANAWGIHDMLGNAWEWCLDRCEMRIDLEERFSYPYTPDTYKPGRVIDSLGRTGNARVVRGGSYDQKKKWCSPTKRYCQKPVLDPEETYYHSLGFRVVLGPVIEKRDTRD